MTPKYDDSDMKVVGVSVETPAINAADEAAKLWTQDKANGNVAKARRAGAILAGSVLADDTFSSIDGIADEELRRARFILANFAVEVGFDAFLPNANLSQTAQNMFDQTLKITSPEWYDLLVQSGAFSFYYLAVRADRGQIDTAVGETFATLCGMGGNKACIKAGRKLYLSVLSQIKKLADNLQFEQ